MKSILMLCAVCIGVLSLSSCQKDAGSNGANGASMHSDSVRNANIEAYNKVNEILNSGNFADLGKYIADNYTEHQMVPGQAAGLEGLKKSMTDFRTAFPDLKFTVDKITADSNMIWALVTMTGTNTGAGMGIPATGKPIKVQSADIIRLENGKCVEHWGFSEDMKMMQQLGMMPPMGDGDMKTDATKKKM